MYDHAHITEIGDDVRQLAQTAATQDIKTDAPECATAVRAFEQLGARLSSIVRDKPTVFASTSIAARTLGGAIAGTLSGEATPTQRTIAHAFATLLETSAAAARE
jgi:hypothetical protein